MKISFGKIVVFLFAVLLIPFVYSYSMELWSLIGRLSLSNSNSAGFLYAFLGMGLFTLFAISSDNFFSILSHELTHNFWAIVCLSRPKELQVKEGRGGNFVFRGRKNVMTVLSPYFFPLLTAAIFPLYFVLHSKFIIYYFIVLGLSFGFSFVTEIKQIHFRQPDLRVYGLLPSLVIIIFFQVLILGILVAFLLSRFEGISSFFQAGFFSVVELLKAIL